VTENNKVVGEKTFTVKMGNLNSDDVPKISIEKGESTAALSNGLYTMLSHDRFLDPTIYMID
jgi:hypothetical protein